MKKIIRGTHHFATFIIILLIFFIIKTDQLFIEFLQTKTFGIGLLITNNFIFKNSSEFFLDLLNHAANLLDQKHEGDISKIELIELSLKNMKKKKTRTIITIGGMTIGIAAIVFLVSIGYGFEKLVINRVARLEEMKQTDISPQSGGKIKINDKTLFDLIEISNVKMALPLIAVVGRVNYQNSETDMAVYGVTTDYLQQSAIKPIEGEIFDSNELTFKMLPNEGQVAGLSIEKQFGNFGEKIQNISFVTEPEIWVPVRDKPTLSSTIIGYTKRIEGYQNGIETWGEEYTINGNIISKWVNAQVLLWQQKTCDSKTNPDCENNKYVFDRDESNFQIQKTGFLTENHLAISRLTIKKPEVLSATTESSESSKIDWVEIASEAGIIKPPETKIVSISPRAKKQAVVNQAMLSVLGIKEKEAVGKKFSSSFVVVGDLLSNPKSNIESEKTEYTIIGVIPDNKTPVFYVPFIDLRTLGIINYSQIKVVVNESNQLPKVRQQIESMGYNTRSVADTVAQINSLFKTVRTLLMLLGMVALSIASLGMFNTLTVSLLERTREVGLMKAMGMKSSEVQELFLTESMIMGFFGGILGIVFGFALGKFIGFILSIFAIIKGVGIVDISYIPPIFIGVIVALSLLVGMATGIYPAHRATKISALNALRYE
jgi:ABC-type antimicrobial peptide transport system permease subunit